MTKADREWLLRQVAEPKPAPTKREQNEQNERNLQATIADELRTEGHQDTRRPLTNPHEPI
jgi:hypothetical protein